MNEAAISASLRPGRTGRISVLVVRDGVVMVCSPAYEWASRSGPISAAELAATLPEVRETGSRARSTLEYALGGADRITPLCELAIAATFRSSMLGGVGPAVLNTLVVAEQGRNGQTVTVEVEGLDLHRVMCAVWCGVRCLSGVAGDLVRMAQSELAQR